MNTNSTEVKNEMGVTGQGGTGDPPLAAGNLPGAPQALKVSESHVLTVSATPPPTAPAAHQATADPGLVRLDSSEQSKTANPNLDVGPAPLNSSQQSEIEHQQMEEEPLSSSNTATEAQQPLLTEAVPNTPIAETPQAQRAPEAQESDPNGVGPETIPDPALQELASGDQEFEAPDQGACIPQADFQAVPPPTRGLGDKATRTRTGKVAGLPDEVIEWINQQIFDRIRFGDILDTLAQRGHAHITQQNLTNWKAGGYLQWLDDQQIRHEKQDRLDAICSIVSKNGGRMDEAAMMLVSSQLLDALSEYDSGLLKTELSRDPQAYHKVIQGLTRLYKAKQGSKKNELTSLVNKPSQPGDPNFILPDAERGLTKETLKKITDAIRLF
jgi:hypothetical protein